MNYEATIEEFNNQQNVIVTDDGGTARGRFAITTAHSYSSATSADARGEDEVEVKFDDGTRKTFTFNGLPK